ncbi:hypothetical protein MASR2M17_20850 [Aminivibrio sp.]
MRFDAEEDGEAPEEEAEQGLSPAEEIGQESRRPPKRAVVKSLLARRSTTIFIEEEFPSGEDGEDPPRTREGSPEGDFFAPPFPPLTPLAMPLRTVVAFRLLQEPEAGKGGSQDPTDHPLSVPIPLYEIFPQRNLQI